MRKILLILAFVSKMTTAGELGQSDKFILDFEGYQDVLFLLEEDFPIVAIKRLKILCKSNVLDSCKLGLELSAKHTGRPDIYYFAYHLCSRGNVDICNY